MEIGEPRPDDSRLSDLIGAIYDCAVDPGRWDGTLAALCDLLDCANGVLYVADLPSRSHRLEKMVGIEPYWAARLNLHTPEVSGLHSTVEDFYDRSLNEPVVCSRDFSEEIWRSSGYYTEWAEPQGIVDVICTFLIRRPDRVASYALGRHKDIGLIAAREIGLARLIAPHLRRAVTISDLIDMKSLEANALAATLDTLAAGIVLVAADGSVVHANRTAEHMFERANPIRSVNGLVAAGSTGETSRLRRIVAMASRGEAEIGGTGIGMALGCGESAAVAHVLSLAAGDVRTRLMAGATAAIFVTPGERAVAGSLGAVAEAYGLTRSETRVLERLVVGDTVDRAAASLDVARTTVRTHLARMLAKTGTSRQADLVALVYRLVPAVSAADRR